ncbi:unnamed protein product, partial [Cyprideis torosa]
MFGIGRDPDLPQVTLWRDFEEPVQLPTVRTGDLRYEINDPDDFHIYMDSYDDLMTKRLDLRPGELSFIVSNSSTPSFSPAIPATAPEQNVDDHETIVKVLLAHGADPNAVASATWRRWDLTPLHIAATPETARLLLEYKAKVDVKDSDGCTPLLHATLNGRHSVVEVLLANGADPNVTQEDGRSPLFVAIEKGHLSVVDVLLAHGADPNVTGNEGRSPLFIAIEKGHLSVVNVLLA